MMRRVVNIPSEKVTPTARALLRAQGMPETATPDQRLMEAAHQAITLFSENVEVAGILAEISSRDFATVYIGEGRNAGDTPLMRIYPSSQHLALFAVTLGQAVSAEISRLFDRNDFVVGSMLDAAASEGAELAAHVLEREYIGRPDSESAFTGGRAALQFSPGYCGWHISGQRKLFEFLQPAEIGIELTDSYLMRPLKSISGVIVVGPREIFDFKDDFDFCDECDTRSCRERVRAIMGQ